MKKTLFFLLTLLAALLVFVSCDESLDADVFNSGSSPVDPVGPVDPKSVPLTLEFPTNGNVTITKTGNPGTIMYSLNGGEKTEAVSGTPIEVPANGTISFYRTREEDLDDENYFTISCTADCYVYGNIMSLVDSVNYATETTVLAFAFYELFDSNENVNINPEKGELVLPATTLANGCYKFMFSGCTSLTTAPELPAATLVNDCYYCMFSGCESLTTAPTLPATSLASYCYNLMFSDCTSLTTAPALPAITLAEECYRYMFSGCTSLTTAPELPATTLANGCYMYMFNGCTSLETAPELPAATLVNFCYENMFSGCSSLNSITCLATYISAYDCTTDWVKNVPTGTGKGTFTKATSADWSGKTDSDGIPSGWTIETVPTT